MPESEAGLQNPNRVSSPLRYQIRSNAFLSSRSFLGFCPGFWLVRYESEHGYRAGVKPQVEATGDLTKA